MTIINEPESRAELSGSRPRLTKVRRSVEERVRVVEESLRPGASVSDVARAHGVRANQVHQWRKLYREGRLGDAAGQGVKLLPVVVPENARRATRNTGREWQEQGGVIQIELGGAQVRVEGNADVESLRTVLECLRG
jgi:transposase